MFKKIITTIPAPSDSGMLCADCKFVRAILQFDGDVREYCNYYEKTCDSNKPIWCHVELIEVTEGIGPAPGPVYYDRNCERIQEPRTFEDHLQMKLPEIFMRLLNAGAIIISEANIRKEKSGK